MGQVNADNYYAANGTGAPTFPAGLKLDDAAGQTTLNYYAVSSTATTFTFNGGGGTTGSVTIRYVRIGDWVIIHFPVITGTSGTGSTSLVSNTALDSFARPATLAQGGLFPESLNNGASIAAPGFFAISTGGIITFNRDAAGTAWTNSSSCGSNVSFTWKYYVGTGS